LLAAQMDVERMRDYIKVDSLSFLSIDGLYRALGEDNRREDAPQFCDACFTGDYPTRLTDQEESETPDQFSLLAERVI
jgi:amidophosphoribosyltransferase